MASQFLNGPRIHPLYLETRLNIRICINLIPAEQTDTPLVANTVEELGRSAGYLS